MDIKPMTAQHKDEVLKMMRVFYDSPAVIHTPDDSVLIADIDNCISDMPYVYGYVFEKDNKIIGYAMTAKSFSTEFGKICIWIEDIYFKPNYRGKGLAKQFFKYIEDMYKNQSVLFRLEAEDDNARAIKAYNNQGYKRLDYVEMFKEN